ncbi:hypothetical protein EBR78_08915 [bacterium]|nr:hypothetical protein [bacterium]
MRYNFLAEYAEYAKALENSSFEEAFFTYSELSRLQEWEADLAEYAVECEMKMNPLWYSYN